MYLINVLKKLGMQFTNLKEKEVSKMTKKIIAGLVVLMMVGMNALPAFAYTELVTPASNITASGSISPIAAAFSVSVVNESGAPASLTFDSTTNVANSGKLLKITAKTNVVNNRIIIYTNNDSYFTDKTNDPRATWNTAGTAILKYSGADGSGLVGEDNKGYFASMFWGMSDTPNVCAAYTFDSPPNNRSWIVDKWHKMTYAPEGATPGTHPLDTAVMYPAGSATAVTNDAAEGSAVDWPWLYPQYFGDVGGAANSRDLYSGPNTTGTVVSEALYKNIATVAYNISVGGLYKGVDYAGYYVCSVPKLSTPLDSTDNIMVRLMKTTAADDKYLYVPIGADFTGKPAQTYSTTKLYVALVQN